MILALAEVRARQEEDNKLYKKKGFDFLSEQIEKRMLLIRGGAVNRGGGGGFGAKKTNERTNTR